MIELKLDHVGLNVSNLEESIKFYEHLFGFDVIEKWDNPTQAFVGKQGVVLGLMESSEYNFKSYTKAHIAFSCKPDAFIKVVGAVRELALEIVSGPKPQRGGESILFRDPSGNILEVCYPTLAEFKKVKHNDRG